MKQGTKKVRYIVAPVYDWTDKRPAEAPGYYKTARTARTALARVPLHIRMFSSVPASPRRPSMPIPHSVQSREGARK